MKEWYQIDGEDQVATPSLLVYPDRVAHNIREMLNVAGDPTRLWPHIKTHKTREIIQLQLEAGITHFKCATIAEAEMVAACQPSHILLAFPLAKSGVDRFLQLVRQFPDVRFGLVTDSMVSAEEIAQKNTDGLRFDVFLDLDVGMHRTGIEPGEEALKIYRFIADHPVLSIGGLHVYDGHLHQADFAERKKEMEKGRAIAEEFVQELNAIGFEVPLIIAGGSPTFPLWAGTSTSLSPGTTLLWDAGYSRICPEMNFLPAAILIARIVSKPSTNRLCLDLGHKAVSAEMKGQPAVFPQLQNYEVGTHSEEHMVLQTSEAQNWKIGDCLYAIPSHICPTVALHESLMVVEEGKVVGEWQVAARKRKITL